MDEYKKRLEDKISYLEETIMILMEQNKNCMEEQSALKKSIVELSRVNSDLIKFVTQTCDNLVTLEFNQGIIKARCDNLKYELIDPLLNYENYYFPVIRSCQETVDEIIQNKKSMARFGDGEFSSISNIDRARFQKLDDHLAVRLKEVLLSHHPKMLIAIASNYGTLDEYSDSAADAIRLYMTGLEGKIRRQHIELLEHDRVYYNAYVSRPYVMYADRMTDAPKKRFENLKLIWKNRKVIVVEGAQTRMGVGNDLLDDAAEVKRILAPATNSFDRYSDILQESLRNAEPDTLFLIAMGPSAGVLAYDLTVAGYQALDIGHVDLEYEWYLAGTGERIRVKYKYNNEVEGDDCAEELNDPIYKKQIIADCSANNIT